MADIHLLVAQLYYLIEVDCPFISTTYCTVLRLARTAATVVPS